MISLHNKRSREFKSLMKYLLISPQIVFSNVLHDEKFQKLSYIDIEALTKKRTFTRFLYTVDATFEAETDSPYRPPRRAVPERFQPSPFITF